MGAELASRLHVPFLDLDVLFAERNGDISRYIDSRGYETYARENVETYCSHMMDADGNVVMALSSGFMTYPHQIHPAYAAQRTDIANSSTTFVLLPSLDSEVCVQETVRRQIARPFGRSPEREEAVIRERYLIYMAIPAPKVETMHPVREVADVIWCSLRQVRLVDGNHG